MSTAKIERRLATLEREIAQLKAVRPPDAKQHPIHTLEGIHGTFEDDEAFREAMRLGRQWRESQRPGAPKSKARHK